MTSDSQRFQSNILLCVCERSTEIERERERERERKRERETKTERKIDIMRESVVSGLTGKNLHQSYRFPALNELGKQGSEVEKSMDKDGILTWSALQPTGCGEL